MPILVVLGANLEEGLGVGTDRAGLGGGFADVDVATVAAFPDSNLVALENDIGVDLVLQGEVAGFVLFFDGSNLFELLGDVVVAFGASFFGEVLVHVGPLVVFAGSGKLEILRGGVNLTVVHELVPDFGVLFLVVGSFVEDGADLLVAVFLGFGGVVLVFDGGLRLAGEGLFEVFPSFTRF